MADEQISLRIKAETLGTVAEIRAFLKDMEFAYNSIYSFTFLVDTLSSERERRMDDFDRRFSKYLKYFSSGERLPYHPVFDEILFGDYPIRKVTPFPNLIDLFSKLDIEKSVPQEDRLLITKINIQSPGFWEFFGNLNPLQQIREYLKDRHERRKDREYRNTHERIKGELDIMEKQNEFVKQRIEILKSLGYTDIEIRPIISNLITEPLQQLGVHQDKGLVEYPEQ
jgi:hypothetical protein